MVRIIVEQPSTAHAERGRALGAPSAVLFDYFGTLAEYEPDRSRLAYPDTCHLLSSWGIDVVSHERFIADWDASSQELEAASRRSLREFTVADAARAYGERSGQQLSVARCEALGASFVKEWQQHVHPVAGVGPLIRRLRERFKVGVVSNTHDEAMVPRMLREIGVADIVHPVVLSVEHGWCKPHHSIYQAALDALSTAPDRVAFVGDNYEADYAGPKALGMAAYLIDPSSNHAIGAEERLQSVLDIEAVLLA